MFKTLVSIYIIIQILGVAVAITFPTESQALYLETINALACGGH